MKTLTNLLFAGIMLLFMQTANADSQDRHLTGFNTIQLSASYNVYLTQGSTESVKVEAPADDINKIVTEVQGGVLKIYNKDKHEWNWNVTGNKKMNIYVTAKDINSIGVSGSGNVYFKEGLTTNSLRLRISGSGDVYGKLDAKTLEVGVSGSGDLKLSGKADNSIISVSGSGDVSARDLITVSTSVKVSGSGDATVYVKDTINASVSGSGDIRYAGSPSHVSTSSHGSGDIHKI